MLQLPAQGHVKRRASTGWRVVAAVVLCAAPLFAQDPGEETRTGQADRPAPDAQTADPILTVPVAPRQRGQGSGRYRGRVGPATDQKSDTVGGPAPGREDGASARNAILDLRSTYIVTKGGQVLSLADWALMGAEKAGAGVAMTAAERDLYLGTLARAALDREPVRGSSVDLTPRTPFGPVAPPPSHEPRALRLAKAVLAMLAPGFADDRPRLVRERAAAQLNASVRARSEDDLMSGPFDTEFSWHADNARKESTFLVPAGLETPKDLSWHGGRPVLGRSESP